MGWPGWALADHEQGPLWLEGDVGAVANHSLMIQFAFRNPNHIFGKGWKKAKL